MTVPAATPKRTPWGLVILLGALTGFAPMGIDMYLPSLPAIGAELRASAGQTQATLAAFLAGMAIGQLIYGPASDRFGRRAPIFVGVGVFVLASVVCASATSPELLIGARFVQALGGCAGGVVARAVIRDRFDHTETARTLSLMTLIMGLAPILAPLTGGYILTWVGWRAIFWFLAAFGLATGVATFLFLRESRSEETAAQARAETPIGAFIALLQQPKLMGYAISGALNGAVLFTYISASPELIIGLYKVPPSQFGWVFGTNALGVILASQVNRYLLERRSPDQVLSAASLCAVLFGLLLAVAALTGLGAFVILPLIFLVLTSYGFMQGNTQAGALSVDPKRAGSVSALTGSGSFAAGALAAWVSGTFHDGTARPMALTILACLIGSQLALRLLALRKA